MANPNDPNNPVDERTKAELAKRGLVVVSREDARLSSNCMLVGFMLSIAAAFAATYYLGADHNAYFKIAPVILFAGLLPSMAAGLRRKSWKKFFGLGAFALVPVLMIVFMFGAIHALVISNDFGATPALDKFVQADFAKYADSNTGLVSSETLDSVVREQQALRSDTTRLDNLKAQFGDLSALSPAARERVLAEVQVAKDSLAAKMLPDEEYQRLQIVSRQVYRVGSPIRSQGTTSNQAAAVNYTADRAQLSDNVHKLEVQYPLWTRILRKLTLI